MSETWRQFRASRFEASDLGRVRPAGGEPLRQRANFNGYAVVVLHVDGQAEFFVHRLVAEVFLPAPDARRVVLHANRDRGDNRATNLVWGRYDHRTGGLRQPRRVAQLTDDGALVRVWPTLSAAAAHAGMTVSYVSNVCRGRRGYAHARPRWVYLDDWKGMPVRCVLASVAGAPHGERPTPAALVCKRPRVDAAEERPACDKRPKGVAAGAQRAQCERPGPAAGALRAQCEWPGPAARPEEDGGARGDELGELDRALGIERKVLGWFFGGLDH